MELYNLINTTIDLIHYPIDYQGVSLIPGGTIRDVIAHQSFDGGWICPECKFHKGDLKCEKNMFISFTGCWTKDCSSFEKK